MSSSYSRDLYFSEKHKQEIIKICVNTPKLSINTLINFCRETEEEIQASRRMSSFQGSDHENFEDQRQSSHGYFPLEKRSAVFSPKQKLVHTLKPYIPRSPVGSQQRTHLTAKDIDDIRLCFIEFIFVSTLSPITCEDLGFLSAKSGLPMSFDDLVSLFGYFCFAPILREMPEFYFLDVYLDKDSKLWFVNRCISSKTIFNRQQESVPEKAVQISIAETAFLEPDMIQFKGRQMFICVLKKCVRDYPCEWVSFSKFQDILCKVQKKDFKTAWKTLIRDVGQIKRVWNEVVYRDIEYDYGADLLRLKDDANKLFQRLKKEQTQAVEFWAKIDIKRKELFGDETNEEEITDDRGNDDWDDNVITEKLSDSKIDKDEEKEIVKEKVLDNNEADSKIDDDKTFDKDAEAGDDEFEEIGTEVSEMNKDDSISSNILATDESSNSVFSSFLKDQPALKTPTVEEISVDTPTKFRKRAIPDGPESDEEEYRLENYPARNENILFNFVSTNDQKTTDAEKTKNESDDENAEIVQYSDEEIVDDLQDSEIKANSNLDFGNFADKEINNDETEASEVLPLVDEIEKAVDDIGYAEMDENVENKEIKIPEEIIETSNLNIEDDKEDNGKNLIHRKPINFSFNKQKFKKIPNFTARKIPTKKCYESESDEEDVRMENTISILYPVENSKTETSDIDIPDGQLKTVIPKAVTNANKSSKLPRASGDKIKRNLKPKFKSTGYIPPANQKADLSKEFDEMVKSLGICDEIVDKTAAVECVKEKKTMMDFGSEAEYSDEESPEYFTSPKSEAAKKDTVEKDDKAKKEKKNFGDKSNSSSPVKPKQFQARIPKKSPSKSYANTVLFDVPSDDDSKL